MPSISERELREHFNRDAARSRAGLNYFDVAIHLAKAHAAKLAAAETGQPTHWNTFDAPRSRDEQQTACGQWASLKAFSVTPTCPACRQQMAIFEAMEF